MLETIKHNKIKNTGIIYEILIRKIIDESVNNRKPIAYGIFTKYFNKHHQLYKQLQLYNLMTNTKYDNKQKASCLLQQVIQLRMHIDDSQLQREKYKCIQELKKHYDIKALFATKLNNYKIYGSVYRIFESLKKTSYNPINIVQSRNDIISNMINSITQQNNSLQQMRMFSTLNKQDKQQILLMLVEKINQKYRDLSDKQKQLLTKYAYTMSDTSDLEQYINEQIKNIKKSLYEHRYESQITDVLLQMDNIRELQSIQDKVYAVLNLYQIQGTLKQ